MASIVICLCLVCYCWPLDSKKCSTSQWVCRMERVRRAWRKSHKGGLHWVCMNVNEFAQDTRTLHQTKSLWFLCVAKEHAFISGRTSFHPTARKLEHLCRRKGDDNPGLFLVSGERKVMLFQVALYRIKRELNKWPEYQLNESYSNLWLMWWWPAFWYTCVVRGIFYFSLQIIPEVSKEQNRTRSSLKCKKLNMANSKMLDIKFSLVLVFDISWGMHLMCPHNGGPFMWTGLCFDMTNFLWVLGSWNWTFDVGGGGVVCAEMFGVDRNGGIGCRLCSWFKNLFFVGLGGDSWFKREIMLNKNGMAMWYFCSFWIIWWLCLSQKDKMHLETIVLVFHHAFFRKKAFQSCSTLCEGFWVSMFYWKYVFLMFFLRHCCLFSQKVPNWYKNTAESLYIYLPSISVSYTNWQEADINSGTANCAAMMKDGKWHSVQCEHSHMMLPYVCEIGTEVNISS